MNEQCSFSVNQKTNDIMIDIWLVMEFENMVTHCCGSSSKLLNHSIPLRNVKVMAFQSKGSFHFKYVLTTQLLVITWVV
jgi:hypothetical protein